MKEKFMGDEPSCTNGPFSASIRLGGHNLMLVEIPIAGQAPVPLTTAEHQVTILILLGLTNQEIADERGTSVNTVKNQVASIFEKVEVNSRAELAKAMTPSDD